MQRENDAAYVADALTEYDVSVAPNGSRWDVSVESDSLAMQDVLTTLRQCLGDNNIPLVHVTIDGRSYMELSLA